MIRCRAAGMKSKFSPIVAGVARDGLAGAPGAVAVTPVLDDSFAFAEFR